MSRKRYVIATHAVASQANASRLLALPVGDDTVSEPHWIRLADGTLGLVLFPRGDTYHEYSTRADNAIADHGHEVELTEGEIEDIARNVLTREEQMEQAASFVLAKPGTMSETDRRNAAIRLAELTLGLTDKENHQ